MPMSLHGPQSLREQVRVQLPQAWPDARFDRTIANDAFRLSKSLRIRDRVLTADYALEIARDQVDAAAVAGLASDIGKAQDLLGDSLSTERAGRQAWKRGAGIAGALALALAALGWLRSRNRNRNRTGERAPSGVDAAAARDAGPETAANDSEQPLAA
jgi:hypothetical protein